MLSILPCPFRHDYLPSGPYIHIVDALDALEALGNWELGTETRDLHLQMSCILRH